MPSPFPDAPVGIGHNQGPPLDAGRAWRVFVWRKAVERAWDNPPIEVVRRRLARARELGMSYREYVALYLDTGRYP